MYYDPNWPIYSVLSSKGVFTENRTRAEACADIQLLHDSGDKRGRMFCIGEWGNEFVCSNCGQPNGSKPDLCVCHREYPETWEYP